jgi:hypothetical protein
MELLIVCTLIALTWIYSGWESVRTRFKSNTVKIVNVTLSSPSLPFNGYFQWFSSPKSHTSYNLLKHVLACGYKINMNTCILLIRLPNIHIHMYSTIKVFKWNSHVSSTPVSTTLLLIVTSAATNLAIKVSNIIKNNHMTQPFVCTSNSKVYILFSYALTDRHGNWCLMPAQEQAESICKSAIHIDKL